MIASALALVAATLLAVLVLDASARIGERLAGPGPAARVCAALLSAFWLAEAGFTLLSGVHAFRLLPAIAVWGVLALTAARARPHRGAATLTREVAAGLRGLFAETTTGDRVVVAITLLAVGTRLLHGLLAPPLAWDALTYHLPKAARFLKAGAFASFDGPDFGFYDYFPHGGEVLWAWFMLPFHSDAPLAIGGLVVWLTVLASCYALARELGGARRRSLLVALAVANVPSVLAFLASGYVDDAGLAGSVLGALFLARFLRGAAPSEGVLAVAGFALAASTKHPALATLALALGTVTWVQARRHGMLWAAGGAAAALVAAPSYVRALVERGSLLWPLPLNVAGHVLARGGESFTLALSGALLPGLQFHPGAFARALFLQFPSHIDYLNPGPGAPVLVALGVWGAVVLWRAAPIRRPFFLLAALAALLPAISIASPDALAIRTTWSVLAGRFLSVTIALLTIPAVAVALPIDALLGAIAAANALLSVPRGVCREEAAPAALLALLVASALLALLLVARRAPRAVPPATLLLMVFLGLWWLPTRQRLRWSVYRAASQGRAWDLHRLDPWSATVLPVAAALDTPFALRLATSAGWNGTGDNWYLQPLLGSRLQNEVAYVPITRDGDIVDYRRNDLVAARADRTAWLGRLVDRRVHALVILPPDPPERAWAESLPDVFHRLGSGPAGAATAYGFDLAAARRRIGR